MLRPFAAVAAGERDARDALHQFRQVGIGEFADVLRNDAVDRGGFLPLLVERAVERCAEAGDDDVFAGQRLGLGGIIRRLLPGRRGLRRRRRTGGKHHRESQNRYASRTAKPVSLFHSSIPFIAGPGRIVPLYGL